MVEIKLIHYPDGIIIECIDDRNARAIVPNEYLKNVVHKNRNVPLYWRSPLTIILRRLKQDFNYTNLGDFKYCHFETEKSLCYNFHRKVID